MMATNSFEKATDDHPYIVLLGDAGSGKSTLVEKLAGTEKRSSNASTSYTKSSEAFESSDRSLVISDTPGANSIDDRFESNLHIAHAFNFKPISRVLNVFKADTRIDNVIEKVSAYLSRYLPEYFPDELIGVCITHMDVVDWQESEFLEKMTNKMGTYPVVFSSKNDDGTILCKNILAQVKNAKRYEIHIESDTFLQLFQISDENVKVLQESRREVSKFASILDEFYLLRKSMNYDSEDQMNMIFEFQAWMRDEILQAQKRFSEKNHFEFNHSSSKTAIEAGHLANMTTQLLVTLSGLRTEAMSYHRDANKDFRKCPHCSGLYTHGLLNYPGWPPYAKNAYHILQYITSMEKVCMDFIFLKWTLLDKIFFHKHF